MDIPSLFIISSSIAACHHLISDCGGKKKKSNGKIEKTDQIPSGITQNKAPPSRASEIPTALRSKGDQIEKAVPEKPATPPEAPPPPKPVIPETKVAEMLPDSPPKSDEMKEGIQLPAARAMKCEGDVEESKRAKKAAEEEKKKNKKKGTKEKGSKEKAKSPEKEKHQDEIL